MLYDCGLMSVVWYLCSLSVFLLFLSSIKIDFFFLP